MKRADVIKRINAIVPIAQKKFTLLRDHLNNRLNNPSDPMMDYEVDIVVVARSDDDSILYGSKINFSSSPLTVRFLPNMEGC